MAVIYEPGGAKLSYDAEEIDKRLGPEDNGTDGQVLTSNGDGTREWRDPTGGVTSYDDLTNKPSINGVALSGNKSLAQLGVAPALQSNVTYYVSNSGSDETGDGTQENPFATVAKALNMIPKNLNGRSLIIRITDEVYTTVDTIGIYNYSGGRIEIYANTIESSASQIVNVVNSELWSYIKEIKSTYVLTTNNSFPRAIQAENANITLQEDLILRHADGSAKHGWGINCALGTKMRMFGSAPHSVNIIGNWSIALRASLSTVASQGTGKRVVIDGSAQTGIAVQDAAAVGVYTTNSAVTQRTVANAILIENGQPYIS